MVSASASLLEPIIPSLRLPPPPATPLRNRLLTWNPLFLVSQSHLSPSNPHSPPTRKLLRFSPQSAFPSPPPPPPPPPLQSLSIAPDTAAEEEEQTTTILLDAAVGALRQILGGIKKPAVAVVLIGVLLVADPFSAALAAGGGRMGGRAFSSRSQSSSSSRSYSAPSRSSRLGFSYSAPYYAPTPFGGGGFFVGPAVGVGFGAGSGFFLLMMNFAAVLLLSGFLSDRADDGSVLTATQKTSVIKLQVGLLGMARSFQKDLDRIAEAADTSTSEGLTYILTETALALLRHPDCCISANSAVDIKRSNEDGEKRFNQLSIEERGKFDEETLVNINSIKRQKSNSQTYKGLSNEYIVVTILVAAEGAHKLPVINSSADLKEALQKIAVIPSRKVQAVEVLWTPQNESDILTERELLEDYPLLRPL